MCTKIYNTIIHIYTCVCVCTYTNIYSYIFNWKCWRCWRNGTDVWIIVIMTETGRRQIVFIRLKSCQIVIKKGLSFLTRITDFFEHVTWSLWSASDHCIGRSICNQYTINIDESPLQMLWLEYSNVLFVNTRSKITRDSSLKGLLLLFVLSYMASMLENVPVFTSLWRHVIIDMAISWFLYHYHWRGVHT